MYTIEGILKYNLENSNNSVLKKLRLKTGDKAYIIDIPDDSYFKGLDISLGMPEKPTDLIVLFALDIYAFKTGLYDIIAQNALNMGGRLLVAYPKKGNKRYSTYVHRDEIFPALNVNDADGYVGKSDYKFNQMISLDDVFTLVGLKRVKREENKAIIRNEDYISYIPAISEKLSKNIKLKEAFDGLSEGYKRNWARYVYSPKQQATRDKHWNYMLETLLIDPKKIN